METQPAKEPTKLCTIVFLIKPHERRVWLGLKKQKVGAGRWNGPGGKVEPGETVRESAINETRQECGIDLRAEDLDKAGIVDFYNGESDERPMFRAHIFTANRFEGEPKETEPDKIGQWTLFSYDALPPMQAGDKLFLGDILKGKKIEGWIRYRDIKTDDVLTHDLRAVNRVSEDE